MTRPFIPFADRVFDGLKQHHGSGMPAGQPHGSDPHRPAVAEGAFGELQTAGSLVIAAIGQQP